MAGERRGDTRVLRLIFPEQWNLCPDAPIRSGDGNRGLGVVRPSIVGRSHVAVVVLPVAHDDHVARLFSNGIEGVTSRAGDERCGFRCHVCLVGGDFLDGVAEDARVFERDASDGGGDRVDHARRVVAPADTDFEDGHVHVLPGEIPQRHRGHSLEEGRRVATSRRLRYVVVDGLDVLDDGRLGDLSSVDRDSFANVVEMWGSVETDRQSRFAEDLLGHPGRTALSVRPGDLYEPSAVVWIAEVGEEVCGGVRPRFRTEAPQVEKKVRGLVVVHSCVDRSRAL